MCVSPTAQLDELHNQDYSERESYQHQIEELKGRCEEKRERVDEERCRFVEFKKQVALNSVNSRSGKPTAPKDIEQYLLTENKKEAEVVNVRLENIKLKNKLKKKEQQLKSKEELAEGLHLIDFEQLKIENQTYNEKIEERNEELLKLRKKITSTVQVLTHLKEKLQYVQGENQIQKGKLQEVEATVGQVRMWLIIRLRA
ncbi:cilia- and flagella-associated protein 184-like [Littorina saxatilis]|uniref:cilia- and flagella-associated protein 184-like n=1 Tax=Littorina saxatilis TaxID=31220 RepID=UPI0038B54EFC